MCSLKRLHRSQAGGERADLCGAGQEGELVGELPGAQTPHACDAFLVAVSLATCTKAKLHEADRHGYDLTWHYNISTPSRGNLLPAGQVVAGICGQG